MLRDGFMTGSIRGKCSDFRALVDVQYLLEDVEDRENYVLINLLMSHFQYNTSVHVDVNLIL